MISATECSSVSAKPLTNDDLIFRGHRYAMVSVSLATHLWPRIEPLCEPAALHGARGSPRIGQRIESADSPGNSLPPSTTDNTRACAGGPPSVASRTPRSSSAIESPKAQSSTAPRFISVANPPVVKAVRPLDIG